MITQAAIYISERLAGTLSKRESTYSFQYDAEYLARPDARAISFSLPLQKDAFEFTAFPPFFDNLLPEGWLSHVITSKFKIDPNDKFALLLALGQDGIGAVSAKPINPAHAA